MEMLSVMSAPSGSAYSSQQTSTQSTTKATGTAPFQQQLNQYVNQTDASEAATKQVVASTEASTTTVEEVEVDITTLNAEQLVSLIEGLIEQVEELIDVPLTAEDSKALNEMSMQLLALLQLITGDNNELTNLLNQFTETSATVSATTQPQINNELLYKLQDQLMLVQQALKDGNLKVIQGQQPEQFLSQMVSQLKQLLDTTKQNSKENLLQQITNSASIKDESLLADLSNRSIEQLKPLAKQAEYTQAANQVQSMNTATVTAQVETTENVNLNNTVPFNNQLLQSTSLLKGNQQVATYTPVNQFADSVKTMVLQKFDLTQLTNGLSQARIMLTPENLGSVDIKLSMQNGMLTAVFSAETAMAKDALENQMSILRGALAAQGITVERMEVTQASFSEELSWEQQRQQAHAETQDDEATDESFEEQLEANVLNQELGYGRAVNEMI